MEPHEMITVAQAQRLIDKSFHLDSSDPRHVDYKPNLLQFIKGPFDLPAGYICGWATGIYIGISQDGECSS